MAINYLSVPADASHEPPEGDDLLLVDDVLQVGGGPVQGHPLDGLGRLAGVLRSKGERTMRFAALRDPATA